MTGKALILITRIGLPVAARTPRGFLKSDDRREREELSFRSHCADKMSNPPDFRRVAIRRTRKIHGACLSTCDAQLILKFTLLMSVTAGFAVHVTRILAVVVAGPVTAQLNVPVVEAVFGAVAAMVSM